MKVASLQAAYQCTLCRRVLTVLPVNLDDSIPDRIKAEHPETAQCRYSGKIFLVPVMFQDLEEADL